MLSRKPLFLVTLLAIITSITFIARYGDVERARGIAEEGWDRVHTNVDKIPLSISQETKEIVEPKPEKKPRPKPHGVPCEEDLSWLDPYKFTSKINYVSRDIITKPGAKDRPLLAKQDEPLFDDFEVVDTTISKIVHIKSCLPPISLEVQHGMLGVADASNMIFGLQTTIGRLRETVQYLERWLPYTGARLLCIVKENPDKLAKKEDMKALEKEFHEKSMIVNIIHPVNATDRFEQRYFSLVSAMYEARSEKTEWIVMIDDDTFFPSLHRLKDELKYHDSSKPQYISALSENWWAVNHYGLMGFGGASIILSVPQAKIMNDHKHECGDHPSTASGDVTVMECIYRFSTTKLTNLPALWQLDIKGDLSGFFESGRPVLSLHHWKAGPEKIELDKTHLVSDICDDCFLQRFQFQDSLVLSNAYTIHTYPLGHLNPDSEYALGTGVGAGIGRIAGDLKKIDLLQMEETWDEHFNVKHSLDPIRPKLLPAAKIQYKILDSDFVERNGRKAVRQIYWKKGGLGERDDVLVLTWIPGDEVVHLEGGLKQT